MDGKKKEEDPFYVAHVIYLVSFQYGTVEIPTVVHGGAPASATKKRSRSCCASSVASCTSTLEPNILVTRTDVSPFRILNPTDKALFGLLLLPIRILKSIYIVLVPEPDD